MSDEGLQKHTLNLYPGDYERIRSLHPDVGAGAVIRRLVRMYLKQIDAGAQVTLDAEVEIKI